MTYYDPAIETTPRTRLTLESGGEPRTVDLYSPQGLRTVASLWLKLSAEYKLMYELSWLGVPVIQLPGDVLMMQELVWAARPDLIIECGLAHGGSAIFYASLLELAGKGMVLAIDREIRTHNRVSIESHPLSRRVRLVEGSSTDPAVIERAGAAARSAASVLVVLDSNHSREHVLAELEAYAPLVRPGGYIVAMDGAQAHVWDTPRGKAEWKESNPLQAIEAFLAAHPDFEEDPRYNRTLVTSSPRGFLRRRLTGVPCAC